MYENVVVVGRVVCRVVLIGVERLNVHRVIYRILRTSWQGHPIGIMRDVGVGCK